MASDAGYPIAAEALDVEIYQLACTFGASRQLHDLAIKHRSFTWLRKTFELSEAARRLIALAVMLRNQLDVGAVHKASVVVGQLYPTSPPRTEFCQKRRRDPSEADQDCFQCGLPSC